MTRWMGDTTKIARLGTVLVGVTITQRVLADQSALTAKDPKDAAAFDPSGYFLERADDPQTASPKMQSGDTAEATIKEAQVTLHGKPYWRFKSGAGAIYVPKLSSFKPRDLDRALCANRVEPKPCDKAKADLCVDPSPESVTLVRAEMDLSKEWVAYTDLILDSITKSCLSAINGLPVQLNGPGLEAGVEAKNQGRQPGSKRIFVQPKGVTGPSLKSPAVGAGVSF